LLKNLKNTTVDYFFAAPCISFSVCLSLSAGVWIFFAGAYAQISI